MRCNTEVVRIETTPEAHPLVGLTIGKIRFVPMLRSAFSHDLESMPVATSLLN
jgi:hypothetical protein